MLSRSSLGRGAQRAIKGQQCCAQLVQKRGLAAPASGSFQYTSGDAAGTKLASRDLPGPTTTLALVAKAGSRYEPLPGLSEALEKFAFLSTKRRSALRIVREAELLGAELSSYQSRENLVLGAKFLRADLPYFVELFSEVISQTKFAQHVLNEEVGPLIKIAQKKYLADPAAVALNSAHGLAFHRGLGNTTEASAKYLDAASIEEFSKSAWSKSNIAVVANGAEQSELSKWVGEFFGNVPQSGSQSLTSSQSKYHGGEERIASSAGNAVVLAFPGSSSFTGSFYKPEIQVLASLLGGKSSIKWSTGFSLLSKAAAGLPGVSVTAKSTIYSDAGLLTVAINGPADYVARASQEAVKTIKAIANGEISKEDIQKAKAAAKFQELDAGQNVWTGLELTGTGLLSGGKAYQLDETAKAIDAVTEEKVKAAAKQLLEQKATVAAVGDLHVLPFAEELGLTV